MEFITIKKTRKGTWMKMFDDYETSFSRISKKEALEDIANAREKGVMVSDGDENSKDRMELFCYQN